MCKKIFFITSIIGMSFIMVFGSGCATLEKENEISESNEKSGIAAYEGVMPKDLPEHIHTELKIGVMLDGYLDVSRELTEYKLKKTVLTRYVFETEKVVGDFLKTQGNPPIKNKKNSQKEDEMLENGKKIEVYTAELKNGAEVQCRDLYFSFRNNIEEKFDLYKEEEMSEQSCFDSVPREEELGFVSIEEAEKKIQDSLSFLEIKNLFEPEVFTFTGDFLQEEADRRYESAKKAGIQEEMEYYGIDFSEEDGYYYIHMKQGLQGVPVYYQGTSNETITGTYNSYLPTCAEGVYGKDGIIELKITNLFNIKEEEEIEIKSFYDMLKKFCNTHGTKETTIKYIGLSYLPIVKDGSKLEFNGQPVWYFIYDALETAEVITRNEIIYNAETGEIMG